MEYDTSHYAIFVSCIIIAILSPVAVVGNALILAALWKKTFQRTPFHLLLSGLALTDLCTGLITQPFSAAAPLVRFKTLYMIKSASLVYFGSATLLIITMMSIERWLYMSRRSLVTSRRGCLTACVMLLIIPTALTILSTLTAISQIERDLAVIAAVSYALVCYVTTCAAYFKVFRIIRQHQQQVHGNHSSQNFGQPAINLAKYKKSVASISYILGLFSFSFLPIITSLAVGVLIGKGPVVKMAGSISEVFLFLSSSLNPCLYVWRMRDVRAGVRLIFCSGN